MMKITINKDAYLKAIEKVVDLEEEAIKGISRQRFNLVEGECMTTVSDYEYITTVSCYGPIMQRKISKAENKVLKEAKKLGISENKAIQDMKKAKFKMRQNIRRNAERIIAEKENR